MKRNSLKRSLGKIERRTFLKIIGGGGVSLLFGGGIYSSASAAPKEILIGDIHPTTGGGADYGKACQEGTAFGVQHVNESGGIKSLGGAKLKLLVADTEGKPEVAMKATEKLIQDGVVALFGSWRSGETFVITQIGEKYKVPTIIDFATADNILTRGFKYSFRLMPSSDMVGQQWVEFVQGIANYKNIKVKTVVIIHENLLGGTSMAEKGLKYMKKGGFEVLAVIPYPYNTRDLSSEVLKIKVLKPDIIAPSSLISDAIIMTNALATHKVYAKGYCGISSTGHSSMDYPKALGKLANYNMSQGANPNYKHPRFNILLDDFKKRFGHDPNLSPVFYNYSGVKLLADALERAASIKPEAIRDALANSNFKDHMICCDEISFDKTGQNKGVVSPIIQFLNGEKTIVWPLKYAQRDPIFPMPSWDEIVK